MTPCMHVPRVHPITCHARSACVRVRVRASIYAKRVRTGVRGPAGMGFLVPGAALSAMSADLAAALQLSLFAAPAREMPVVIQVRTCVRASLAAAISHRH